MKMLEEYLRGVKDIRKEAILAFHVEYSALIYKAKGSSGNHQNWIGGYADHIAECFRIAEAMYDALLKIRPLPFSLDSAFVVLYFHDIEKIWKYTTGENIDKEAWYGEILPKRYIVFSEEEQNALEFIHGENDKYQKGNRAMCPLAAFCHSADTLSARMWYNEGRL